MYVYYTVYVCVLITTNKYWNNKWIYSDILKNLIVWLSVTMINIAIMIICRRLLYRLCGSFDEAMTANTFLHLAISLPTTRCYRFMNRQPHQSRLRILPGNNKWYWSIFFSKLVPIRVDGRKTFHDWFRNEMLVYTAKDYLSDNLCVLVYLQILVTYHYKR